MRDEFVFAVMRTADGKYVVVEDMPEMWDVPEEPYTVDEIDFIVSKIAFDIQNRRIAEEVARKISPEQEKVSEHISAALKRRKDAQ